MAIEKPSENPVIEDNLKEIADPVLRETFKRMLEYVQDMFEYYDSALDSRLTPYTIYYPQDLPHGPSGDYMVVASQDGDKIYMEWT